MYCSWSTALRNTLGNDNGFKGVFAKGCIKVYSGAPPATADGAVTGTLLGTISDAGGAFVFDDPTNGLDFEDPVAGVVAKAIAQTWEMLGVATGTAGWGRLCANAVDDGTSSTSLPRVDFDIGSAGTSAIVATTRVETGLPWIIQAANFVIPG